MNIFDLIKARDKLGKKATALRDDLAKKTIDEIDSSHRMTRVIFPVAHKRWTSVQEKALVAAFTKFAKEEDKAYQLLSAELQLKIIRQVAQEVKRTPEAVRIRLRQLNKLPLRSKLKPQDLKKSLT